MDKGRVQRDGKIVSGGHTTMVEGLKDFLRILEKWSEITSIRLGRIEQRNTIGRKSKRLKPDRASESGLRVKQQHKRAKGGGGFSFRATRMSLIGTRVVGIHCYARHCTHTQTVVLTSDNLDGLKLRLCAEGFGANW